MSVNQETPALVFIENSDGEGFYTAKVTSSENLVFVKNLSPFVSNEMLSTAFATFGEIKTSFVFVDSESDSLGCGLVAFATKQSATLAYRRCRDMHFLITSSTVPVKVSLLKSESQAMLGLPEILLNGDNQELVKERMVGPRFINQNCAEKNYVNLWTQLLAKEREAIKKLREDFAAKKEVLEKNIHRMIQEEDRKRLRERIKAIDRGSRSPTTDGCSSSSHSLTSNQMQRDLSVDQMPVDQMPVDQVKFSSNEKIDVRSADDNMGLENEANATAPFSSDEYF